MRLTAIAAGAALVVGTTVASAGPATASQCNTSTVHVKVLSKKATWKGVSPTYHFINETGRTQRAGFKSTVKGSVKATVSAELTGGASFWVAKVRAKVSSRLSASVSYSTSLSTTVSVPRHTAAYAQLGTNRYTVRVREYKYTGSCHTKTLREGTLTAPTTIGWKVWTRKA